MSIKSIEEGNAPQGCEQKPEDEVKELNDIKFMNIRQLPVPFHGPEQYSIIFIAKTTGYWYRWLYERPLTSSPFAGMTDSGGI
jgi:hypothetical protein